VPDSSFLTGVTKMTKRLYALLSGVLLAAVVGAQSVAAGAGQGAPRTAAGELPSLRTTGYGQSFDWHRPVPRAAGRASGDQLVLVGRGSWICSPAGAGQNSQCQGR